MSLLDALVLRPFFAACEHDTRNPAFNIADLTNKIQNNQTL